MLQAVVRITVYQSTKQDKTNTALKVDGQSAPFNNLRNRVFQFYRVISANIDSSWDNIIQKAQVVLPRRMRFIHSMEYSESDYLNLKPSIFTKNIETTLNSKPLSPEYTLDLSNSNRYSLINYNNSVNNGFNYDKDLFRVNPLIQRGDLIVIQLGYVMGDKEELSKYNTIEYGNEKIHLFDSGFAKPLPTDYAKSGNLNIGTTNEVFDINNRWKPYNRGFQFKGYVSKTSINNDGNILLDCEDYMYIFNRAKIPNKVYDPNAKNKYGKNWTLNKIFDDMLGSVVNINDLPIPVIQPVGVGGIPIENSAGYIDFSLNHDCQLPIIKTENATIGDVFRKIKDDFNIPICFRPNTDYLVATPFVYNDFAYDPKTQAHVEANYTHDDGFTLNAPSLGQEEFLFITGIWSPDNENAAIKYLNDTGVNAPSGILRNRQNIISSDLEFKRTNDQFVGATVKSQFKIDSVKTTGEPVKTNDDRPVKTPQEHSVHVGDYGGTEYTFFFLVTSETKVVKNGVVDKGALDKAMKDHGKMLLDQKNYTGLYGSFKTFGYPYVQFSDIVTIVDLSFPERNGRYYVKKVIYNADVQQGITQEIHLDYKLPDKKLNITLN